MPKVSVVIPCYNQGQYLDDAVESVRLQTFDDIELIIVNDGSDEQRTIEMCSAYEDSGIKVLTITNQGLAAARNKGIEAAKGTYILPLDADDKIAPSYIAEAVAVIEAKPEIGIVYCRASLFGAVEGDWNLPDYSLKEMLRDNVIFCSALFRKSDWSNVGGYDTGMVYGWEDYEFWLSLIEKGLKVHRLDDPYFYYRVSPESMVRSKDKSQKLEMFKRIYRRHLTLFSEHIESWLELLLDIREPYLTSRLYVGCGEGLSNRSSVARKVEPGKRTIRYPIQAFNDRRALRFDPAECPVCINVESIEVVSESGRRRLQLDEVNSNADFRKNQHFKFASDDPYIFLPVSEESVSAITEVIITCDITAHGTEALREIISILNNEPSQRKKNISPFKWFGASH